MGVREEPGRPAAGHPRRRPAAASACCWCWTTASTCWTPAPGWPTRCCGPAPDLRVLATSREALGIAGETAWPVPAAARCPAARPPRRRPAPAALARYAAVRLFVERAAAVRPGFALTAENAAGGGAGLRPAGRPPPGPRAGRRPGAGAAARRSCWPGWTTASGCSPAAAARRLARQQTLRAAVDWSYALLARAGAGAVRPAGGLRRRLDAGGGRGGRRRRGGRAAARPRCSTCSPAWWTQSLVRGRGARRTATARYRLLETLRQYARERLAAAGEAEAVRARHAAHFLALAERGPAGALTGRRRSPGSTGWSASTTTCGRRCAGSSSAGDAGRGTRLAAALRRFWWVRGHTGEARRLERRAARAGPRRSGPPRRGAGDAGAGAHRRRPVRVPAGRPGGARAAGGGSGGPLPPARRPAHARRGAARARARLPRPRDGLRRRAGAVRGERGALPGGRRRLGPRLVAPLPGLVGAGARRRRGRPAGLRGERAPAPRGRRRQHGRPPDRRRWASWPSSAASARAGAPCWRRAWPASAPPATATTWPWS